MVHILNTLTAKHTIPINRPTRFPPVPKNGTNGPGVVHGTPYATGGIILNTQVAPYPIIIFTIGAKTNGIIYIGFNTIGNPNITISFILNIPGANESLAILLCSLALLNNSIAIINPNVAPEPPYAPKAIK